MELWLLISIFIILIVWINALWVFNGIDFFNSEIEEKDKTIKRMEVWVQNQIDREKELLERIKYLESLTK